MRRTILVVMLAALAYAVPASAQTLVQRGCHASAPGFRGVPRSCARAPIKYVVSLALSPDGRHLYSANGYADPRTGSVAMFSRDRRTGALRSRGCLANERRTEYLRRCATAARIGKPEDILMAADGRHVYLAASRPEVEVAVLRRDPGSGALTPQACLGSDPGCTPGLGLDGVHRLELSGDFAYGVSESSAVAIYARDADTGALSPLGCLTGGDPAAESTPKACASAPAISQPSDLAVSPDGRHVYVTDSRRGHVAIFARDGASLAPAGVARVRGGDDLHAIAISPDGANLYVSGLLDVHVFRRDRASGALTLLSRPIAASTALSVFGFAFSGRLVYTAGGLDGIAVHARSREGRLRQLAGRRGCVSQTGVREHWDPQGARTCLRSRSLVSGLYPLPTPDGRHLYVSGTYASGGSVQSHITIFQRRR